MSSALDRPALAAELAELSQRFADEADRWTEPTASGECFRAARQLSQLVRALDDGELAVDLEVARAYVFAADLLLGQLTGVRRFFAQLAQLPTVRRPS